MVALEAMEALGGNGYVEETPLARLYREAPVNSIWEGSGNVICLDVVRAARREPAAVDALFEELGQASGANPDFDASVAMLRAQLENVEDPANARRIAQAITLAFTASVLIRSAPAFVADAFCASRLGGTGGFSGAAFGALPADCDATALIRRASGP
jgi:putative acyl-CoA dehydrogenase